MQTRPKGKIVGSTPAKAANFIDKIRPAIVLTMGCVRVRCRFDSYWGRIMLV